MDRPATPLFPDVTLGLTSWRAPATLAHTLASYADAGILPLFGGARIHVNEITDADREIASRFGLAITGTPENLGIFGAVEGLAAATRTRYLLSVENDCPLVTDRAGLIAMLGSALADMTALDIPIFQMRSRRIPGEAFDRAQRYQARFRPVWPIGTDPCQRLEQPSLFVRAYEDLRKPRLRGCAIYAEEDPTVRHPGVITKSLNGNWLTTSRHLHWSNNCVLVRTDFLRTVILDRVRRHPAKATVNGFQDIEAALKTGGWWRRQGIAMGQSEPGAFTHKRLDR
jgi:hypothetical protein